MQLLYRRQRRLSLLKRVHPVCNPMEDLVLPQQERAVVHHGRLNDLVAGEDAPRHRVNHLRLHVAQLLAGVVHRLIVQHWVLA